MLYIAIKSRECKVGFYFLIGLLIDLLMFNVQWAVFQLHLGQEQVQ